LKGSGRRLSWMPRRRQDIDHDSIGVAQGEGSKPGVPAFAQDPDFCAARVLRGLHGPDEPRAERERSNGRGEHAPRHQHPDAVTTILCLDSPLERPSRIQNDPAMGRGGACADLRDRDVRRADPRHTLLGLPLDGRMTMPFGQEQGDHVDRNQDPASLKAGGGRQRDDLPADADLGASDGKRDRPGTHQKPDLTPRPIHSEAARNRVRNGTGIDIRKSIHGFDGNGGRAIRKDDPDLRCPDGWTKREQEPQGKGDQPATTDEPADRVRERGAHALFCWRFRRRL